MIASNDQPLIAGRYLLDQRLGSGGMGTVWRATDQLLQRTVAVKELHLADDGPARQEHVSRALREARTIARVSHPHVVDVYDLVEHGQRLWIVMELIDGPSLAQHMDTAGPLPVPRVAEIGLQLLAALDAVHAVGALHRDVKPANILLRGDGSAVLSDFGIAALLDAEASTSTGSLLGSAAFIAPERLLNRPAGPAGDLFSLGTTLCLLATGVSPFDRPSSAAVLQAVAHEEPHIPDAAGPLAPLIEDLLRKNPGDRPSSTDAANSLRRLGNRDGATLRHTLPVSSTPRRPRRRLKAAAVSATALLAVAAIAGYLVTRPPAPRPATGEARTAPHASADAVMRAPDDKNQYWVFSGSSYILERITGGQHTQRRILGPRPLTNWTSLADLPRFAHGIDAVMQVPDARNRYWVFSGDQYIEIQVDDGQHADRRTQDPRPLTNWTSFADLPRFTHRIDAVMQVPDARNRYWVFSGDQYIEIQVDDGQHADRRTQDPRPLTNWTSLADLPRFTHRIDAVMPLPEDDNAYRVFSGNRYIEIRVNDEQHADQRVLGPKALTPPRRLPSG